MPDNKNEKAQNSHVNASDAANENSGYSFEGDTPPAEGAGVGPTNREMDVERPGEGSKGKIFLVLTVSLIAIFLVLGIIGRVIGMF